jgi:hypothetical protein
VVNIELTLVSIIQGVALFFLIDNAPHAYINASLQPRSSSAAWTIRLGVFN